MEVFYIMDTCNINPCELTTLITALANFLAQQLTDDELTIFSAMTTQLGDTLETISAQRSICCSTQKSNGGLPL
jgi:hypothetical protein